MHTQAKTYIKRAIKQHGPFKGRVVEFGSRDINGGIRELFPDAKSYLGIDIASGDGVDLVIDAADWQPRVKYCCVVSTETFEHTKRWPEILVTASKAVSSNGVILITCATSPRMPHSASRDKMPVRYGEYYGNVSENSFRKAAKVAGLKCEVKIDASRGDLYATCWLENPKK